jgi:ferritin
MSGLSKAVNDALNGQTKAEIYSAYLYLSMSAYCDSANLPGAAHWLRLQWKEELEHATKLIDHVIGRGGTVVLEAIKKPPAKFGSLHEVFEQVLNHEQEVTASIYKLYELSVREKDYATQTLLQWYVDEQVEEEKSASEIVSMLQLAGRDGPGLLMVDRHLAERTRAETEVA